MKFTMRKDVPDGTVFKMGIRYEGQSTDKVWTYVWLKAGGLWYGTGNTPTAAGWGAVERWLADKGRTVLWVVSLVDGKTVYEAPSDPVPGVRVRRVAPTAAGSFEARAERLSREPGLG